MFNVQPQHIIGNVVLIKTIVHTEMRSEKQLSELTNSMADSQGLNLQLLVATYFLILRVHVLGTKVNIMEGLINLPLPSNIIHIVPKTFTQ